MMKTIAFMTTAAALAIAAPANATILQYTLTGLDGTGTVEAASFQLDSTKAPSAFNASAFAFYDVAGIFTYGTITQTLEDIIFYTSALDGGFFTSDYVVTTAGPQLFTGSTSAPVLSTGTFALTDYYTGGNLTLTVTPVGVSSVPEPASWAMMIGGFGVIGGAMRRRRTKVSFAAT